MLKEAFDTAAAANVHGFEMGKKWVDENVAKNKSSQKGTVGTQVAGKFPPDPLGVKS